MRDRIRPPRDLEKSVLDRMKEDGITETKQKGMMLAAAIGFALDGPDGGQEVDTFGEGIRLEYFERAVDDEFIGALAVAHENDLTVLSPKHQDRRTEIFERYASVGLRRLKEVFETARDPLIDLANLLQDLAQEEESGGLPGLEGDVKKLTEML